MSAIKLDYVCFLNHSGYSQAAQNMIFALSQNPDYDIKLTMFGDRPNRPAVSDENYEIFMKMLKKPEDSKRIVVYHCVPHLQKKAKKPNQRSIGFGTFETFQPPEHWARVLNENDAVIAPSLFNQKIFKHEGVNSPIYYIPHCLDFSKYNRKVLPMYQYDKYTFLFMGIWRERKGFKPLIEAWLREFSDDDSVQLVIKTDKPKKAGQYVEQMKKEVGLNKGFAPVIFENKVFDEKDLPRFIKSVDCLISPTMGEGFGYPGLQCMALGIPVAITNFSGCQDYANEETAILIEPSAFVLKEDMDRIPQFRNKKWAFVEVKKVRRVLRRIAERPVEARIKVSTAHNYVKRNFSYERIENLFTQMVRELYG